jgi:hypothetical protein
MRSVLDGSLNLTAVRRFELASRAWGSTTYRENVERIDALSQRTANERIRDAYDASTLTKKLLPGSTSKPVRPRTVGRKLKEQRADLLIKARDCNYELELDSLGPDNSFLIAASASTLR